MAEMPLGNGLPMANSFLLDLDTTPPILGGTIPDDVLVFTNIRVELVSNEPLDDWWEAWLRDSDEIEYPVNGTFTNDYTWVADIDLYGIFPGTMFLGIRLRDDVLNIATVEHEFSISYKDGRSPLQVILEVLSREVTLEVSSREVTLEVSSREVILGVE